MRHISFLLLIAIILMGCKKDPVPSFHHEYFGWQQNRYVIYNVTEIIHNKALAQHDTLNYQLKTVWRSEFVDNEGRDTREFERYTRNSALDPWVLVDVWHGGINGIRAELVEENQRRVKLVFAPTLNKLWDANAQNMEDQLDCYYRNIHQDTVLGGVDFDSTLVVEQANFVSIIDTVRMYEVYAKHKGLIYKYSKDNHWQPGSSEVFIGNELYYEYLSSGVE